MTHSIVNRIKKEAAEKRLEQLEQEYKAVNEQLSHTLNAADQVKLKKQLKQLEHEMEDTEKELNEMERSESSHDHYTSVQATKPTDQNEEARPGKIVDGAQETKEKSMRQLSVPEVKELVILLLKCPSMDDKGTRNDVLAFLPDNVRNAIPRRDQARADVVNIVRTCQNYTGGLDELIEAVRSFDGGTLFMDEVDEFLNTINDDTESGVSDNTARGHPHSTQPNKIPAGPVRNRWALLVGINNYYDHATLKYCVKDVEAMEKQLSIIGYKDSIICMHDELDRDSPHYPTRTNVDAELKKISKLAGHDDLILVYFACHGVMNKGERLLVMRDTREHTPSSFLSLNDVELILQGSQANRFILLLDACRVGTDMGRSQPDPAFIRNAFDLAEGIAFIAASTSEQTAHEWDEEQHGLFTYYLLEGLAGKADQTKKEFITVKDLETYVVHKVKQWILNHDKSLMEPNSHARGIGDMIVADYRKG